ncbi:Clavaminate synthase-like protein [Trematosphaeria pertusa]|uniref:Clavaminate synthase-like protein n=1 Tax=Trematosphaeria pertusa TaxID=390896 RepID=A0A6A6HSL4_9PLEO|nr:Clavaminate synthase-like protein [Trematosphaeria pertusa]KAF2241165.1 Clavaminate synthase-like protein [Trematosphaeria pertusa]
MIANAKPSPLLTLPTIRLDHLRSGDTSESKKLIDACRNWGFFYLDLTSDDVLCRQWEEMLVAMKDYFEQPLDVKMQDARQSDNYGYEPQGTEVGPRPDTVDGYESLKISRREFLKGSTDLTTASALAKTDLFFDFSSNAHTVTIMMLERLSDEMGLKGGDRFEAFHNDKVPSLTNLTLLRYPKHDELKGSSVGHNKHTDIGSLTFLLAGQWGLQALSPDQETWAFVEPRPKHAVINVGDSLRFPSKGQLLSAVHRVIPIHEKQHEDRYSIAYFLRIANDTPFRDAAGKLWSAKEWHDFKFDAFRAPASLDPDMQVLTGMMERDDVHVGYVDKAGAANAAIAT